MRSLFSWTIARMKLKALTEGAQIVRAEVS
jgi:hypothetical protein